MTQHLQTAWLGDTIALHRGDELIDSVSANDVVRVIFVYRDRGQSPGDLSYALIETPEDCLIFPADTGISGRVLFERQAYWQERSCIYWVSDHRAALPGRLRRGGWFLLRLTPAYARVPREQLEPAIASWPLEGPQTWEQRKWERIQRSRPFGDLSTEPGATPARRDALRRRA